MVKMKMNLSYSAALLLLLAMSNDVVRSVEAASVRLTKNCFTIGETITIRFSDVEGEGVFVGLYPDDVSKQELPEITSPSLKEWILTCGDKVNCESWPQRGIVQLSTSGLEQGTYFMAISGNRNGLTPQATSLSFQVGQCSSSFFGDIGQVPSPVSQPIMFGPTQPAPSVPTPRPTPTPVQHTVLVVTNDVRSVIDDARRQIENLIRNDGDLTGKFLRLVFHDCIGGCNGCVDMANPDNAGLDKPVRVLQPIVDAFLSRGMTRTDIWMLSGLVAIETALPADDRDILFDMNWIGRRTCEAMNDCGVDFSGNPSTCTAMRGPHVGQAHAIMGTRSIQSFFEDEFNFTPQQVTALMGAHSVGKMSRENSGFQGRWDLSSTEFDGGYWIELIGEPPEYFLEEVSNRDLNGIPNRMQWRGIVSQDSRVTMLHTDIALVRNIEDMVDGQVNCQFTGPNACSRNTPFLPHAQRYVQDNRAWLLDFRDVFSALIDHGHDKAGACPSGQICTFGFQSQNTLSIQSTVTGQTIPSIGGQQGVNGASIFLDKKTYNCGETAVATYNNLSGQDIWIGILDLGDVPDFRDLPASPNTSSGLIKEWHFSCGFETCHTWTSNGGLQLRTNGLGNGEYIVVVSGDGGSLDGQAATTFRVAGC